MLVGGLVSYQNRTVLKAFYEPFSQEIMCLNGVGGGLRGLEGCKGWEWGGE